VSGPALRGLTLAAGAALTALVVDAELTTRVDHNTAAFLILGLAVAWSFLIAGLLAWVRRPSNPVGALMCGIGLTWLSAGLSDSPHDILLTFSLLVSSLWIGLLVHLILAYPTGRLGSLDARIVTAAVYVDTWLLSLIQIPFAEPAKDGSDPGSAHNLLLVEHSHRTVTVLDSISLGVGIALIAAILIILVSRWRAASPALRRTLAPVYLTGAIAVVTIGVVALVFTVIVHGSSDVPFYLFSLTFAAIPQGFVYGLLRTQIGRSSAVSGLIAEIETSDQPARLRDALRVALGDPTLELIYRLPDGRGHTDADGQPAPRPHAGPGRAVTPIESGTRGAAVQMVHDDSLLDDPGLLDAATAAAALALRNQSLTGELAAQLRELRASEQRLSELLENVRLIAVSLDTAGLITYANPFLCELTGWSKEELLGRDWLEVFGGEKVRFLERVASDDVLPYEENWIRTRTGDIRDIAWNNTVLRDRDGRIVGATSIGEDITLRRRNERRMGFQLTVARALANADRLEDVAEPLVEAVGAAFDCWACIYWKSEPHELVPVAVWARRGVVSDGFVEQILDSRPHDDTGLAWYVRERGKAHWDLDVADDPVVAANTRCTTAGSFAFPVIAAGQVDAVVQMCSDDSLGPDPEMLALMEAVADRIGQLIDRRRAEAAVAQSEARKSAVLHSALDCIVTIDTEDRIVEFNPAAERTFGRVARDVIGQQMPELLIPPRYRHDHRAGLAEHLRTGGGRLIGAQLELAGMRADGSEFPIELAVTRIEGEDGPLFTAFIRDITDRKHVEEELRRSRARIVTAGDEARRRLERNLHDGAQQRLVSLSLSLRLARSQFQRDPSAADAILEAAGEELAQALEELRELARGIHPAILTDRGLQPALEALANRASVPVELVETPERPLPPPVEAAAYYVVSESLANVAKYANAKRATVRIVQDNGSAVIEVRDDGVGGADPTAGTGLRGLADRVEALDGMLSVESPEGEGTFVRAVIPCG
jgi:PAS domain S-box-containing protein